jgi:hypothetical protein
LKFPIDRDANRFLDPKYTRLGRVVAPARASSRRPDRIGHCTSRRAATMKLGPVRHDTRCAVCWGTMKKVKVVSPCLHRFCAKCIEEHIRKLCVSLPRASRIVHFPSLSVFRRCRD